MAQFDVYQLSDGLYVVDVQSPLATVHPTRLVVPLIAPDGDAASITRLNPAIEFDGSTWLLGPQFMTSVDATLLKTSVGSLVEEEWTIKASIDFHLNGF
ncbi:toxin CcdB [Sphingomonas jinjuensis]|uniref:Toxin CcdB n=1 Tax=Sphingomonas jinjuensis TaxID=535907 RepID=A0A840FA51_9SPHN|nr:CcdB family protein [Sphingomonas jinjuensis]MBB4152387.1 toxin CcdB [Sphingomonas jinjuensis]